MSDIDAQLERCDQFKHDINVLDLTFSQHAEKCSRCGPIWDAFCKDETPARECFDCFYIEGSGNYHNPGFEQWCNRVKGKKAHRYE